MAAAKERTALVFKGCKYKRYEFCAGNKTLLSEKNTLVEPLETLKATFKSKSAVLCSTVEIF